MDIERAAWFLSEFYDDYVRNCKDLGRKPLSYDAWIVRRILARDELICDFLEYGVVDEKEILSYGYLSHYFAKQPAYGNKEASATGDEVLRCLIACNCRNHLFSADESFKRIPGRVKCVGQLSRLQRGDEYVFVLQESMIDTWDLELTHNLRLSARQAAAWISTWDYIATGVNQEPYELIQTA